MNSTDKHEIDEFSLATIKDAIPDLLKYRIEKTFDELYDSDCEFCIVRFYDRTDMKNRYESKEVRFYIAGKDKEAVRLEVKEFNTALREAQTKYVEQIMPYDSGTYFAFSSPGIDLGLTHLSLISVNKTRDEREKLEEQKEHEERMASDSAYRKEQEWFSAQYRPYDGAFESQADFARHVGLKVTDY